MVSGRCQIVSGRCQIVSGRCQIASGRCQLVSGKCQMASGGSQIVSERCQYQFCCRETCFQVLQNKQIIITFSDFSNVKYS